MENNTVRISDPLASIDVGALGKGYATEMAAQKAETLGCESYVLNVGGNIRIIGTKPDGSGWNPGIRDPQDPDGSFAVSLDLSDTACVTSGTYERYYMVDGEKYHHIIDKDTLYPADYFESLTVVTKDSGLADALSTALFCMSYEDGLALAEKLGVEPQFVEGEWDGLLAGLDAGRYDIMVNGVDITPDRAAKYDFSTPYAYNRTAVITRADDDSIQTLEDLNGKTTANTISSTYAQLAEQYGATVTAVDDLNQTFELLNSGRIDATLNAEVTFYDYTKEHPDANVKIAVLTDDANEVAIPMRKGEETATLRAAIDTAIEELRADGTLKALSEKYFGTDISTND